MEHRPARLSILIPNYDNGRASSRDGTRDFLDDLLRSLAKTLADDPTPVEIIIVDDGSSDDSLATARAWAKRRWTGWRSEKPFCRLIEGEHTGVLSVVANRLTVEAQGEICCRLDGDIVMHTPRWAERLVHIFDAGPPDLGIVGAKQLMLDGRIHSAGSWILHPRGHHHVAQGFPAASVKRSIEVDHVMGCFYAHRRAVWEELGGYDETFLRGQTVDFSLRARMRGWRVHSVPNIVFTHAHADRKMRATEADSPAGMKRTLDRFTEKWGFDRLAPDLDDVARRYAGSPLLWNAAVFGPLDDDVMESADPIDITRSEWARYVADEAFREAIDWRVRLVSEARARLGTRGRALHVGCRSGLICRLLAQMGEGVECVGVDRDAHHIDLARAACEGESYPGPGPAFEVQTQSCRLPIETGSVDLVLLVDIMETHPNPVRLLREAWRVLADEGGVAIVARERTTVLEQDDRFHAYRPHELLLQLQGTGLFEPCAVTGDDGRSGWLRLLGRRVAGARPAQPVGASATVDAASSVTPAPTPGSAPAPVSGTAVV